MTTIRPRTARSVVTGAMLALGAASLVAPSGAAAGPASAPGELGAVCVADVHPGAAGSGGDASYDSTVSGGSEGKKPKKKDEPETAVGSFGSHFELTGPSCPGVDYVLTVTSVDGSPLGWATTGASTNGLAASPLGAPQAVTGGGPAAVTITWPGDGFASEFAATGTTAGYFSECVFSSVRAVRSDGSEVFTSQQVASCDTTGGGTSYF